MKQRCSTCGARLWRRHPFSVAAMEQATRQEKDTVPCFDGTVGEQGEWVAGCRFCWLETQAEVQRRIRARQKSRWTDERCAEANAWELTPDSTEPRPEWGRPLGDLDTVVVPSLRDLGLGSAEQRDQRRTIGHVMASWASDAMRPCATSMTYKWVRVPWELLRFGSEERLPGQDVADLIGEDNEARLLAAREQGIRDVIEVLDAHDFYWPDYAGVDMFLGRDEMPF